MNLNYPVVLIRLNTTEWSEFGHFPLNAVFSLEAFVTERGHLPKEATGREASDWNEVHDDVVRDIASCEWVLYGIIRGSNRRYLDIDKSGLTVGFFATTYFSLDVAIVESNFAFISKCGDWGISLEETAPPVLVDEVTDPKKIEWLRQQYKWDPMPSFSEASVTTKPL
ncbi:TPA_asm: hypothetical protein [ssRNA phage Gephyllon.1_14]|uniref:Uncharacterized protein n=2 Tax=Fiersviridae TaxID=2842319 RepID=A0A8S5KXX3_9VIRU|nr:hypothetical protein QIK17_gp3 [ssRNA phage Gephyllon.1_14]QDH91013.1 MAG: hypothetical protein H1BulkLitter5647_000003 [Leviviridae sp.]DAD50012.1 TPA_asm: hypothetical protein [ssRNA phage Gephyllon.1_14]